MLLDNCRADDRLALSLAAFGLLAQVNTLRRSRLNKCIREPQCKHEIKSRKSHPRIPTRLGEDLLAPMTYFSWSGFRGAAITLNAVSYRHSPLELRLGYSYLLGTLSSLDLTRKLLLVPQGCGGKLSPDLAMWGVRTRRSMQTHQNLSPRSKS